MGSPMPFVQPELDSGRHRQPQSLKGDRRKRSSRRGAPNLESFEAIVRRVVTKNDDRSSLVAEIACVVGAEILEGVLAPGSDINSVELARRFRTSRTPAREAVLLLEKESLVEVLPRRRPRVASLSVVEIREIYRVRGALLGMIAGEVAEHRTETGIAELRAIFGTMESAAECGRRDSYFWANVAFHELLAEQSGNKTLQRIIDSLMLPSLRLRRITLSMPERIQQSVADHARLIVALEDGDAELASALAKSNVLSALKLLERLLAEPAAR